MPAIHTLAHRDVITELFSACLCLIRVIYIFSLQVRLNVCLCAAACMFMVCVYQYSQSSSINIKMIDEKRTLRTDGARLLFRSFASISSTLCSSGGDTPSPSAHIPPGELTPRDLSEAAPLPHHTTRNPNDR